MPETFDKERARKILQASIEDQDDIDHSSGMKSKTFQQQETVPFTQLMMNMRNQMYQDPFDEFDPHHRISGKKAFNNLVRCLQSKINLRFKAEDKPFKPKQQSVVVKQEFLEEFDRKYIEMCDNKKMNIKQRGISQDNPFNKSNKLPMDYVLPNKILDKPGNIKNLSEFMDERPLAGRFTEIGEKIFKLGSKKANQLCTGPWGHIQMLDGQTRKNKKLIPESPHKKQFEFADNHTRLHKMYVPQAYMTNPNISYCGGNQQFFSPENSVISQQNSPTALQMSEQRLKIIQQAKRRRSFRKSEMYRMQTKTQESPEQGRQSPSPIPVPKLNFGEIRRQQAIATAFASSRNKMNINLAALLP